MKPFNWTVQNSTIIINFIYRNNDKSKLQEMNCLDL